MGTTTTLNFEQCPYCGLWHEGTCPRIESIEYHPFGQIKKVVFRPIMDEASGSSDE